MFDGFELHKELQSLVVQLIKDAFFLTEKKKKKSNWIHRRFPLPAGSEHFGTLSTGYN